MLYSQAFPKTKREVPTGAQSLNHQLLTKAGFIDQLMAGSWTLLPLGLKVISKLGNIIRDELNKTGAQEIQMPLLHPKEIWARSGRWDDPDVKKIMYQFQDIHQKDYGLSFTHEEIVMDLLGKNNLSYKDLPIKVYQFSTKFRNEPRAKSGILRGREFLMKDLYSAHTSQEDMQKYYQEVKDAYIKIFERIGFQIKVVEASGGVFTDKFSHEFQVVSEVGEDIIYYCSSCDFAQNQEIFKWGKTCHRCGGEIKSAQAIEVGNIFPLGTKYSEKMKVFYKDEKGEDQKVWFASYGIGPTRTMGALVEVYHDEKGIIWPQSVAPFQVHLVGLDLEDKSVYEKAEKIYKLLMVEEIEVLFDDRLDPSPGEKFADADLIGIPYRVVISKKTHSTSSGQEKLEVKKRSEKETEFTNLAELVKKIKQNGQ